MTTSTTTTTDNRAPDILVRWIASTFVLVLNWWENDCRIAAREADGVLRALVEPALVAAIRNE